MTDTPTTDSIRATLAGIAMPDGGDLISGDRVRALSMAGGTVRFVIEAASAEEAGRLAPVKAAAEAALAALPGITKVQIALTAHDPGTAPKSGQGTPPDLRGDGHAHAPDDQPPATKYTPVPGVARILVVGSGKGGVGKSTVSANLAVALARAGWRVGLLDADIYGPSVPRMLGVDAKPEVRSDGTLVPLEAFGIKVMSVGLLLPADAALVWRGPMLQGVLKQFMTEVHWGELDVMVVDMPPGTGDVQLTLCKEFDVAGAIVVSTPQDVALLDARKALDAFRTMGVDVVGLIENMSRYVCPTCGTEAHLFGDGGVRRWAEEMGLPLLAELPLALEVRTGGDAGAPVAAGDGPLAQPYHDLARMLIDAADPGFHERRAARAKGQD